MPLIVLEGIDGCGKSTQHRLLVEHLQRRGIQPELLREPGGTALGERIREILLDPTTEACAEAELFAYQVARAQLVRERLRPLLQAGRFVVLDRFWYSTVAYQAYGLGLGVARVRAAIDLAVGDLVVDHALYLRVTVARAAERRGAQTADRIEARGSDYLQRVHAGYEALAASGELTAVDGERPIEEVHAAIWSALAID